MNNLIKLSFLTIIAIALQSCSEKPGDITVWNNGLKLDDNGNTVEGDYNTIVIECGGTSAILEEWSDSSPGCGSYSNTAFFTGLNVGTHSLEAKAYINFNPEEDNYYGFNYYPFEHRWEVVFEVTSEGCTEVELTPTLTEN